MGSEMSVEKLNLHRGDVVTVTGALHCEVYGGYVQIAPEKIDIVKRFYQVGDYVKILSDSVTGRVGTIVKIEYDGDIQLFERTARTKVKSVTIEYLEGTELLRENFLDDESKFIRATKEEIKISQDQLEKAKLLQRLKEKDALFDVIVSKMSKEEVAAAIKKMLDLPVMK